MKAGAVEFLTKPFRDQDLLDAIRVALERDRARREQEKEVTELQQRFGSLTPREQEVIAMVASGMLNKQIAGRLGTAENTVKVHRSRAMEKMRAIMESTGAQIRPLLTAQQQEKYDAMKKAHDDMHKAMQEMRDAEKK